MRVVLQPETEQVVLNRSKLTLILEKLIGLLWLKFVTTYFLLAHRMMCHLSCRVGMGGIWELLDGKIWEWDLSFRWEWEREWSHWNGRELVRKICSRTPLVWVGECFFWYRPTQVVPDKRPLNGCVCVAVTIPTQLHIIAILKADICIYHPTEGVKLSQPRCCSKSVQAVCIAVAVIKQLPTVGFSSWVTHNAVRHEPQHLQLCNI